MPRPAVDRPSKIEAERTGRPERTPIHGNRRNKLTVKGQEPGFHYCFVNAENVPTYEAAGYEFVTHPVIIGDKHINYAVETTAGKVSLPVGNGVTAFLMRCTEDIYNEEMEANAAQVDELEAAMKAELNSKANGRYGKVTISDKENY